mmetsp:Transcript_1457/g.3402  ORF Transcript_1457/g.3402 Transcript_1457/m.3402 type:complete len:217 (-) Transcript_1457:1111-1761(-)
MCEMSAAAANSPLPTWSSTRYRRLRCCDAAVAFTTSSRASRRDERAYSRPGSALLAPERTSTVAATSGVGVPVLPSSTYSVLVALHAHPGAPSASTQSAVPSCASPASLIAATYAFVMSPASIADWSASTASLSARRTVAAPPPPLGGYTRTTSTRGAVNTPARNARRLLPLPPPGAPVAATANTYSFVPGASVRSTRAAHSTSPSRATMALRRTA